MPREVIRVSKTKFLWQRSNRECEPKCYAISGYKHCMDVAEIAPSVVINPWLSYGIEGQQQTMLPFRCNL
jgi:hypothetical protein